MRATSCGASKPCPFLNPAEPLLSSPSVPCRCPQNSESSNKLAGASDPISLAKDAHRKKVSPGLRIAAYYVASQSTIEIRPLHACSIVLKEGPINKDCDQHVHHARTYIDTRHFRGPTLDVERNTNGVLALMQHLNMLDAISRGTRVRGQSAAARGHRPLP